MYQVVAAALKSHLLIYGTGNFEKDTPAIGGLGRGGCSGGGGSAACQ